MVILGILGWLLGSGSGSDGSGSAVRFTRSDFQAKPLMLDPFQTKFDGFWVDGNFGHDLRLTLPDLTWPDGHSTLAFNIGIRHWLSAFSIGIQH